MESEVELRAEIERVLDFYGNATGYRISETYRAGEFYGIKFDQDGPIGEGGRQARELLQKLRPGVPK